MILFDKLLSKIKTYNPSFAEEKITKAFLFAQDAHKGQKRMSGEDFITHPLEVAHILADMKLDEDSIISSLLHDTVEDTKVTINDIRKHFGTKVETIIDGVTKLSKISFQCEKKQQAENFRKFIIATSQDIRVLIIKLADRLHNMRTLKYYTSQTKKALKAQETMDIYVPLAERIGLNYIKSELEDLCFAILEPETRESILTRLYFIHDRNKSLINNITSTLEKHLKNNLIEGSVKGRRKSPYSIWRKMEKYNVSFEDITDIIAFRIILNTKEDCYKTLGIIHSHYHIIPERFKDYISNPKTNQYQSIHTSIFGPLQRRIEVQIRTNDMHTIAERGIAAHWCYKQGESNNINYYKWIRNLIEILEHSSIPEELLENTKLEMYQDQVFCFTPKGDLINLPQGATIIDFAYAIHSDIGNSCVGGMINNRMSPLKSNLKNGDQVEIITSKSQTPSPAWEKIVVTGKALSHIRRFIKTKQREQYINLGKSIFKKYHKTISLKYKNIADMLKSLEYKSIDSFYTDLGQGILNIHTILPEQRQEKDNEITTKKESPETNTSLSIDGLIPGMAVHYAKCCHPLPGEKIIGIIVTGKGVTIHTDDCPNLKRFSTQPKRWIDVSWQNTNTDKPFFCKLFIRIFNKKGSLSDITSIISKKNTNIINLKIINRTESFFELYVDIEIGNLNHLHKVIADLRTSKYVHYIERKKG